MENDVRGKCTVMFGKGVTMSDVDFISSNARAEDIFRLIRPVVDESTRCRARISDSLSYRFVAASLKV